MSIVIMKHQKCNDAIHAKYHTILLALGTINDKTLRNSILRSCSPPTIRILSQIATNILNGNIPINKSQFKRLKKYCSSLRHLSNTKSCKLRRKLLINQKGGFLPLLIPIIASSLGGILSKVLK